MAHTPGRIRRVRRPSTATGRRALLPGPVAPALPVVRTVVRTVVLTVVLAAALVACGSSEAGGGGDVDEAAADSVETPELGACRVLSPDDVAQPSNATEVVDCAEPHTAETFAVGDLPDELHDEPWDSSELGKFAYGTCGEAFQSFLGVDESRVMRSVVSWAWFRPSEEAWADGARWYRCDAVGGGESSASYVELPETARGMLRGAPEDRWSVCADGETVAEADKVPCTEPHTWRAVTTIKVGEPADAWPGERLVEVTSRDFCSSSVGAWLNYPLDYEFGWTAFGEGQWEAGNRRSVCWARTDR